MLKKGYVLYLRLSYSIWLVHELVSPIQMVVPQSLLWSLSYDNSDPMIYLKGNRWSVKLHLPRKLHNLQELMDVFNPTIMNGKLTILQHVTILRNVKKTITEPIIPKLVIEHHKEKLELVLFVLCVFIKGQTCVSQTIKHH